MSKRIYWKTCKKTSIFIDAANVFYSQKTLRWRVDYEKFLNFFKKRTNFRKAYFYSAVISTHKKQKRFFAALNKIGYEVITREVKVIKDRRKKVIVQKGNFDVKLAIDLVLKAKEFDTAVLVSGDSDFEPAVEYLRGIGKKVIVVSSRGHISRELAKAGDVYLPLEKIKKEVLKI